MFDIISLTCSVIGTHAERFVPYQSDMPDINWICKFSRYRRIILLDLEHRDQFKSYKVLTRH